MTPPTIPHHPFVQIGVAAAAIVTFALLSSALTPRGPVSAAEALVAMAAAVVVGLVAAAATGSRAVLVLAPVAFVVAFEVARIGAWGPTVDAPGGLGLLQVLAFLLGRAVHGALVVPAMLLGTLIGLMLAPRFGVSAPRLGTAEAVVVGALVIGVAALGVAVWRPATTAPILAADGQAALGSVAELTTAIIGGHEQALMVRGRSTGLPVLLHLAGGPGGTDIGAMRLDTGLEERFVVVTWDQRGTGKSYRAFDPAETLTLEQVVADTIEVSEYLRDRFGQARIFIAGQSWGSIPATLAVQRRPELYHALVTTGQMVSIRETDRIFYEDTLAWARSRGDGALVGRLESMGPPPYTDLVGSYPVIVGPERALNPYPEFDGRTEMTSTIWRPEFALMEKVGALRGLVDVYARLYPQLQDFDFREQVPRLEVPVWLVMGRFEARGRVEPARAWFDALDAPAKDWVVFDGSSHRANFERPAEYARLLDEVVAAVRASEAGDGGPLQRRLGLGEIAAAWETEGDLWLSTLRDAPYHLTIFDSVVTELREQYVP